MSELNAIETAFNDAVQAGRDEEEVKMAMINAGAQFKNVNKLFNDAMVKFNYRLSKNDVIDAIKSTIKDKDLSVSEIFKSAIDELFNRVKNFHGENDAKKALQAYCRKNEIEYYKEAKSVGRSGFSQDFYNFLRENPDCTEAEATAFINGEGENKETSENTKKHIKHFLAIWKLVKDIYNS